MEEQERKDAVDWIQVDLPRILNETVEMLGETRGWLEEGEIKFVDNSRITRKAIPASMSI